MENGTIYSVRRFVKDAERDEEELKRRYENATIKTYKVQ
jgi:hypothetical protein